MNFFESLKKNKAFMSFFKRGIGFAFILLLEILFLGITIDFQDTDLSNFYIYTPLHFILFLFIVLFFIVSIKDLLKIKKIREFNSKQFIFFFGVNLVSVFTFYLLNSYLMNNAYIAAADALFYSVLWYINGFVVVFSLVGAFFDFKFIKYFLKNFKNKILLSGVLSILSYTGLRYSFKLWPYLSKITGWLVYLLLNLIFNGVGYSIGENNLPNISVPGMKATIASPCSGIEGMGLFLILFLALILIEYKQINIKKALFLFPLGILGAFLVNVLRTFLLFVVGSLVSARFAQGGFHSNAGWILFTLYFLGFIYFSYPWMKK